MTNQHATLSASQSLTFSLGGVTPGAPVALPTMPLSRSQQVGSVHSIEMITTLAFFLMNRIFFFFFAEKCVALVILS